MFLLRINSYGTDKVFLRHYIQIIILFIADDFNVV